MNKHLKNYLKKLYNKDNYYLLTSFFSDSFYLFEDLENDFDYFIDMIEDLKDKTILTMLKRNYFLLK